MSEEQSLVNRILKLSAIGALALAITLFAGALWTYSTSHQPSD